jgi:hypothetical protein
MAITALEARTRIRDDLAAATDQLALAVACLSEAYEQLDVDSADRMEAELFRPVQKALGRSKRTQIGFAERFGLPAAEVASPPDARSQLGVKVFVERASAATEDADRRVAQLQDSIHYIEFGDAELRAGLGEVRELLTEVPGAARQFLRTLGR